MIQLCRYIAFTSFLGGILWYSCVDTLPLLVFWEVDYDTAV